MSLELLSPSIRKYIREKRWEQLRPIQAAAIARIMTSDDNYILASKTASGKTEAAFLPILSKVDFNESGVQVLYISPLIALINDQFERVEKLCRDMEVQVTKWHGEANKTLKDKLAKNAQGIVLITPESIEAMFVNKPYQVKEMFSNLKYIVIDEIHVFIGSDRGVQLKSLLSRLQAVQIKPFSIVGLSATLGDFGEAKKFTGDEARTKVLLDRSAKEIDANFRYFEGETTELPLALLEDLYDEISNLKTLIFPNSRGCAEEVAVRLLKIAERVGGHQNYFSHHSSVDKQVREYVEEFAKSSIYQNFAISCTSTLELGIDIGTVDAVVQVDATHSIASLIQRIGRSGRKEGAVSKLFLYVTSPWSLLQSLACWLLYKEGFIEPPSETGSSFDILLHQALSITKGHSGIKRTELSTQLSQNFAFNQATKEDIDSIIKNLVDIYLFEQLRDEVIIGVEGEKIVNKRDFYSVFKTEVYFKVINAGSTIGQIPLSPQIKDDENILLAAKIWKIKFVDHEAKKIEVIKALDGKSPVFSGDGADIHRRIREKMFSILFSKDAYEELDEVSLGEIRKLRRFFSAFKINDIAKERPLLVEKSQLTLYTFSGSRINRTLSWLLDLNGIRHTLIDSTSSFIIKISPKELRGKWTKLTDVLEEADMYLENMLTERPGILGFSKWGRYLPVSLQVKLLKQKYFDLDGVYEIKDWILIENREEV